ncbi:hypothetical protein BGZ67_003004 [Mortierella alpina]|nr:hypothetical protein BGZ67_003004 [Mortierella alpina]
MVALPTSTPTLVSSSLSASPLFAAFARPHSTHSSCASSQNFSPGASSPSSPSSSTTSSPRFPCMDPVPGRVTQSPSATVSSAFPLPISHPFSKLHKSSSMPSPPEQQHYSSIHVKTATASLDQAIVPIKSALAKIQSHDHPSQGRDLHLGQPHRYRMDHDPSTAETKQQQHSRIDIANLLCTSEGADQDSDYAREPQQLAPLRAITEEADDREAPSAHTSPYGRNTSSNSSSRDSHYAGRGEREYAGEHRGSGREPLYSQRHTEISYTEPPRASAAGPQQRSASWNTDRHRDYSHSYEQEQEQERQRRTDRSKSDYALHQQNYGPYLNGSPPLTAAALPRSYKPAASSSSSSSSYSSAAPKRPIGIDSSAPLSYNSPHTAPPSASTSSPVSSSSSSPYVYPRPQSSAVPSSSSARPIMHNYAHTQKSEAGSSELHFRQGNGPILPPPAAMLSGTENKPPRVYGRDSTADEIWQPVPRPARVVPVDAPNEIRPYSYSSSSMLPPPYPPTSASSSSASAPPVPMAPYPSSYSSIKMEPKPRRIYGIDAADPDIPQRMPPPASSSAYRQSQYSKPLQDIPDSMEAESARRHTVGEDTAGYSRSYGSSANSAYGSQSYRYSATSGRHYTPQEQQNRYDYEERGWKVSQQRPLPAHETPSAVPPSSYAPSRPYSRPQSPSPDIKPPSWYQNYAHSVAPKPQAHPSYQHADPYYRSSHAQHHQAGEYSPIDYPLPTNPTEHGSSSKRPSKPAQSVHPFDTTESKSGKSKKPKRIKNPGHEEDLIVMDDEFYAVKAKRKRANASQLSVLNAAFERSYFPSTEERLRLSKQCRMCPRTVQIWFQNKRQSVKARSEAMEAAAGGDASGRRDSDELTREERQGSGSSSSDGQKRSIDDDNGGGAGGGDESESGRRQARHLSSQESGGKRRSSGMNGTITPSEAVMSALHIQLDGRSVDYFSRKRRATIAKMEQGEQQKQKQQQQQQQQQQEKEEPFKSEE